ncbi:Autophagy-related protein 3 [Musa troglodytarum]|uniref:Autophagy-related protein 3 n=1 Tax=Musa troglodytarum TaxID=320322 RepID=A0A9E7EKI7_9LILI|nr:Autophagy-related protein 3 [Musa troglodytarum]
MVLIKLHEVLKSTVELLTRPHTVSAFKKKGVLSISEFILAGDNLVAKCPTWSWEVGEPSKRKSYLPADKQYLITRNVPCLRRASSMEEEYDIIGEETLFDTNDEDISGWIVTHRTPREIKHYKEEAIPSMEFVEINKCGTVTFNPFYFAVEEDIPDMADYENLENPIKTETENSYMTSPFSYMVMLVCDNIVTTKYDKYYQTPHVWLTGYDEWRMPLQPELIFEDVNEGHTQKTVTIENHPHLCLKHASVHPCRHAAIIKKMLDVLISRGIEPEVDRYLFLFLKFIYSVFPTIEYDYTMDFDLGSSSHQQET